VAEVPLPPERAFVVQLRLQSDPGEELFVGRVEHLASGEFVRFRSAAELLAFHGESNRPHQSMRAFAQWRSRGCNLRESSQLLTDSERPVRLAFLHSKPLERDSDAIGTIVAVAAPAAQTETYQAARPERGQDTAQRAWPVTST
jgi:hypothetical protein